MPTLAFSLALVGSLSTAASAAVLRFTHGRAGEHARHTSRNEVCIPVDGIV